MLRFINGWLKVICHVLHDILYLHLMCLACQIQVHTTKIQCHNYICMYMYVFCMQLELAFALSIAVYVLVCSSTVLGKEYNYWMIIFLLSSCTCFSCDIYPEDSWWSYSNVPILGPGCSDIL